MSADSLVELRGKMNRIDVGICRYSVLSQLVSSYSYLLHAGELQWCSGIISISKYIFICLSSSQANDFLLRFRDPHPQEHFTPPLAVPLGYNAFEMTSSTVIFHSVLTDDDTLHCCTNAAQQTFLIWINTEVREVWSSNLHDIVQSSLVNNFTAL